MLKSDQKTIILSSMGRRLKCTLKKILRNCHGAIWDIDIVIESTGVFRDEKGLMKHIEAGAKKVILSAPAKGDVKTLVMGVNEESYDAKR